MHVQSEMTTNEDICCVCYKEEWGLPVTQCCLRRCHPHCNCNLTTMPDDLQRVCLIVDFEGFFVKKAFLYRELGWRNWSGERGSRRYKLPYRFVQLSDKDKRTANYTTNHVNGLPFNARPMEAAVPSDRVPDDVVSLYERHRTTTRDVIGYKGGNAERDLLHKLGIPSVNLEDFGCPKFEHLVICGFEPCTGCGSHIRPSHCAMVECDVFFRWVIETYSATK